MNYPFIIRKSVVSSQVDFNQHMHDAEYNSVFSEVISRSEERRVGKECRL